MESINKIINKSKLQTSQRSTETSSTANWELKPEDKSIYRGKHGGDPNCKFCFGTGFVLPDVPPDDPRFGRAVVCVCRRNNLEEEKTVTLAKLSQLGLLTESTFESFKPEGLGLTPDKQRNIRLAYDLVRQYAEDPQGWLILRGGYGCGKTHLAAAVANFRIGHGHSALFINTPDLLDHLRSTFSPLSTQTYDQRFDEVRNAPLLILDDLGAQNNTEWVQEKLYQIFNHRYTTKLPTIITTNEEFESFDIRVRSRLEDTTIARTVVITAPDFRRGGVDQDQSDLSTLDLHKEKTFENFDIRDDELPRKQADNLFRAFELSMAFAENPQGWLVFQSNAYANGKTHLAAAIANHVSRNGDAALFVVVPDLLDHLRSTFNPSSIISLDKRFNEVKTAPFLVLDDLGTESATAWAKEKLYQLFNYRYNAKLPTVITTSIGIDEIDRRLLSRMMYGSHCTFFVLEAPSYRGKIRGRKRSSRSGR